MPFIKGVSGNPAGRPKGSTDRFSKYRRMVEKRMPDVIATVLEMALDGDLQAARLLLNRVWPEGAEEIRDMEKLIDVLAARVEELTLRKVA